MTIELSSYLSGIENTKFPTLLGTSGGYVNFKNSGQRGSVKEFTLSLESILSGLEDILDNLADFEENSEYVEKAWRDLGAKYFKDLVLNSMITVQTKPTFTSISKIVSWANNLGHSDDSLMLINEASISTAIIKLKDLSSSYSPVKKFKPSFDSGINELSKPFILLAGISGTGKTRFVRHQAENSATKFGLQEKENLCLVPVRPDWHEPSDLLGYISRLDGTSYVATDFLKFTVKALCAAIESVDKDQITWKESSKIPPYWLCLDEMNLAPVEQYFSDYLSILETREWNGDGYTSHALLSKSVFDSLVTESQGEAPLKALFNELLVNSELPEQLKKDLTQCFIKNGIPLPPNLIVAGTVNMDETTHGFSRKVLDRALSFDFGKFFPNDFDDYFEAKTQPKLLTFPTLSQVTQDDLNEVSADKDGLKSITFLKQINEILKDTPFELAYRALNELLLSVKCTNPQTDQALQAVWDDFLMCKVLPRIEGDSDKLSINSGEQDNILSALQVLFGTSNDTQAALLSDIWQGNSRPDLLREKIDGSEMGLIPCRSKDKLEWMLERLEKNKFTSFWP